MVTCNLESNFDLIFVKEVTLTRSYMRCRFNLWEIVLNTRDVDPD